MLRVTVPEQELFDEVKQEFITVRPQKLQLEHSLVSISKWESKWKKPFLSKTPKTNEETLDYIRCMTITQNVPKETYYMLPSAIIQEIQDYIEDEMTATTFTSQNSGGKNKEVITSELIYYWMIAYNIPFECQKWHLNRLITLINICSIKNQPPKKRSRSEIINQNRILNKARRKQLQTRG
jgi:hypothetical protein